MALAIATVSQTGGECDYLIIKAWKLFLLCSRKAHIVSLAGGHRPVRNLYGI